MAQTWVDGTEGSGFGVENLPFGVFSLGESPSTRVGVRIGSYALDLRPIAQRGQLPVELAAPNLNPLLAAGRPMWDEVRERITGLLVDEAHRGNVESHLVPLGAISMRMPFDVADYVDFYSEGCGFDSRRAHYKTTGQWILRIRRSDGRYKLMPH